MKSTPLWKLRFSLHKFAAILGEMGRRAALYPPSLHVHSSLCWWLLSPPSCPAGALETHPLLRRVSAGDGSFLLCYLGRHQPGLPERCANVFGYALWKTIPKPCSSVSDSDGRKALLLPAAAAYGQMSSSLLRRLGTVSFPLVSASFPRQGELGMCRVSARYSVSLL